MKAKSRNQAGAKLASGPGQDQTGNPSKPSSPHNPPDLRDQDKKLPDEKLLIEAIRWLLQLDMSNAKNVR